MDLKAKRCFAMQEDYHVMRGRQHKSYWPTLRYISTFITEKTETPTKSNTVTSKFIQSVRYNRFKISNSRMLQCYPPICTPFQGPIAPVSLANQELPELTGSRVDTSIMDSSLGTGEAAKRMTTKETWIIISQSLSVCCKPSWLTERGNEGWDQWVAHSENRFNKKCSGGRYRARKKILGLGWLFSAQSQAAI